MGDSGFIEEAHLDDLILVSNTVCFYVRLVGSSETWLHSLT